jgi:hypothetical protein
MHKLLFVLLVLSLTSCKYFKQKFLGEDEKALAHVGSVNLYASDIADITKGLHGEDSTAALKAYGERWIRKQLMLQKAVDNIPSDDPSILKKVESYREDLLLYEYEKALIVSKLDTSIKQADLQAFYEANKQQFLLENDVYLLFYAKLPKDAPDLKDARQWLMKPKDEDDLRKIEGYCKVNAIGYSLATGLWYNEEALKSNFELAESEIAQLGRDRDFHEYSKKGQSQILLARIADVLHKGDPLPMEMAMGSIKKVLIEKRRIQLVKGTYERAYTDAMKSKDAELFVK